LWEIQVRVIAETWPRWWGIELTFERFWVRIHPWEPW